jgi:hypothetical protein
MPARLFRKAEKPFRDWVRANPAGYVVNTTTRPSRSYFVLHSASCPTLHRPVLAGGYTERDYMKACTSDATPDILEAWIRSVGGPGFTRICAVCSPEHVAAEGVSPYEVAADFDEQVDRARMLSSAERAANLRASASPPTFRMVMTTAFVRSPVVAAEVLERAAGHCERCGKPAPFFRASNNTPYLEVHHRIRLADGGYDSVENAIALCPNCHRRLHHGLGDERTQED